MRDEDMSREAAHLCEQIVKPTASEVRSELGLKTNLEDVLKQAQQLCEQIRSSGEAFDNLFFHLQLGVHYRDACDLLDSLRELAKPPEGPRQLRLVK